MANLEERIRLLEDERAILETMHAYAHSVDYDHEDAFLDCFVEDATLHWGGARVGRGAIAEAFRVHAHAPGVFSKHLTLEARITVEGDRATASSYFARVDDYPEGPQIRSYGRYEDVFVRCDDGRWRFQERRPHVEARRPG